MAHPADLVLALALAAPLAAAPPQDPPPAKIDFEKQIQPILAARCYECHGPDEQEADLRLDDRATAFAATGVLSPGAPDQSELLRRISLPADDDDVMPNDGDPLTAEQIALLRQWIAEGAEWPEGLAPAAPAKKPEAELVLPALEGDARARAEAAMQAISARGGLALPVAMNTAAVDVNWSLLEGVTDQDLALLEGLEPVLVWLNLARSGVSDAGLARLAGFAELRRLNLSGTKVGDAGLTHLAGLSKLEYLNLYGTEATDAGLRQLEGLGNLKKLFLWQSKATDAGAAALAQALPGATIDLGRYAEAILEVAEQTRPCNDVCPLTGKPVDPAYTVEHEGLRIGFCCGDCREKFSKSPADHAAKVAELRAAAPAAVPEPVNTECPVSGKPVDPAHTVTHEGRLVGFCCAKCQAKFTADPSAFAGKLPRPPHPSRPRPPAAEAPVNTECPVSGKPVDPAHTVTHEGRVVAFCCAKCQAKFTADPSAFAGKLPPKR